MSLLKLREAAALLDLSPITLRGQHWRGRLRCIKRGRDLEVSLEEIERYREKYLGKTGKHPRRKT